MCHKIICGGCGLETLYHYVTVSVMIEFVAETFVLAARDYIHVALALRVKLSVGLEIVGVFHCYLRSGRNSRRSKTEPPGKHTSHIRHIASVGLRDHGDCTAAAHYPVAFRHIGRSYAHYGDGACSGPF